MTEITITYRKTLILLSVAVMIGWSPSLSAQSLISDVIKLAQAVDSSVTPLAGVQIDTAMRDSTGKAVARKITLPTSTLGILAAYAYPSREEALKSGISADAILEHYRNNPYLKPFLADPVKRGKLSANDTLATIQTTIRSIRGGVRESILGRLNNSDVYADNRMLQAPRLIAEYKAPRISDEKARETASIQLFKTTPDPASLTSNVLAGLADWVGKRAKEELVQTFLLRLTENLTSKQLDFLFPKTVKYLENFDVTNYRSIISSARLAFAEDLNMLSLNVPNYLVAKTSDDNPLIFNSLLVYRLVNLARRDIPLPSLMAYAGGDFSRRRFESEKILHDNIAAMDGSPAYDTLQSTFGRVLKKLTLTFDSLGTMQGGIENQLSAIEDSLESTTDQWNDKVKALEEEKKTITETAPQSDEQKEETAQRIEKIDDQIKAAGATTTMLNEMFAPSDSFRNEVQTFSYLSIFRDNNQRLLKSIEPFLKGQLDYEGLKAYPSVDAYTNTFYEAPPSSDTLRAVGLTMVKEMLRRNDQGYEIIGTLDEFAQLLFDWKVEVSKLEILVQATPDKQDSTVAMLRFEELHKTIEAEEQFWKDSTLASEHEIQAFQYLWQLAGLFDSELPGTDRDRTLPEQVSYLQEIEQLFEKHTHALKAKYPTARTSPYTKKMSESKNDYRSKVRSKIAGNIPSFDSLQAALDTLNNMDKNKPLLRSYTNAQVFSGVLQSGAQLLYALADTELDAKTGTEKLKWVSPASFTQVLSEETPRQFFLGLLYQRISAITGGLSLSPLGLEQVANQVVLQLQGTDTLSNDRSRFLSRLEVATGLVNSILETPLIRTGTDDRNLISLIDKFSFLKDVPTINNELTELIQHTENEDYRYGFDNVMRLIDLFNVFPAADTIQRKKLVARLQSAGTPADKERLEARLASFDKGQYKQFRNNVFRYGQFIADVAAADDPGAVTNAFQSIAAPRGSSLNKRVRPYSIDLNAYFGGALSHEWIQNEATVNDKGIVNSYGLFVPVGLAFSKQLSKSSGFSLSLFLPLIDLGALTAYRTDATSQNLEVLPDFSFANVLAPGAHLFLNFPKSPLFVGGGFQSGPNVREFSTSGETKRVKALRMMLTFGVDVPLISFTKN